jgi:protein-disulfide isomerase
MSKRFWLILVIIIVALGLIFKFTDHNNGNSANTSGNAQPTNHVEGSGSSGVTLVEYGDYECPYCEEYYPVVKQIAAQYNQQIFFQFRNLPLTQIHVNAFAGARAAEAASLQGQFWQMHDALYDNQNQWVPASNPESFFVGYAQKLGLNTTKFQSDYAGSAVNDSINADVAAFAKTGFQEATPTFILDGKQIQPSATVASFESFINAEIAKKAGTTSTTPAPTNSTSGQSVQTSTTSNSTKN